MIDENEELLIYNIILLGNTEAGKTSFIFKYINDTDNENIYKIGYNFKIKMIKLSNGDNIKLKIWDTTSQENLIPAIIRCYVKSANGLILLYNITSRDSFEYSKRWLKIIRERANNNNIALVGNHIDREDYRIISTKEGQDFANDNNLLFFETSAIQGINVNECFDALVNEIYRNDPKTINKREIYELKNKRRRKTGCLK